MKAYWDSSALVKATLDAGLRARLRNERGITRTHTLAEAFSAFTGGNLAIRMSADDAAKTLEGPFSRSGLRGIERWRDVIRIQEGPRPWCARWTGP